MGRPRDITHAGGKFEDERLATWTNSERRALRQYLADLPSPRVYARYLKLNEAQALMSARKGQNGDLYVLPEQARILIPLGLCEAGKNRARYYLGGFGFAVLKALREDQP